MVQEISSLKKGKQIPHTVIPRYHSDLKVINTGPGNCDDHVQMRCNVSRTDCELPSRSTIALGEDISSLGQGNQIPRTVIPRYNSDLKMINTGPVGDCDDKMKCSTNRL